MPKIKVLLVDDHNLFRQGLHRLLDDFEQLDIVGEAANGQDALDKVARWQPDLVLMDLRMPGMDGLQTTRVIRRADWGSEIPVIAISASAYDLDRRACLEAGCDDFMAKPFRTEELLELICNLAGLSWTRDEVDQRLKAIMRSIHDAAAGASEAYGKSSGVVNYVQGANIAGFLKVANAMLDQGLV